MRIVLALILLACSGLAAAQKQRLDQIVLDGGAEPLLSLPLKAALDADPKLAERLKRQSGKPCDEVSRGYLATWAIRDNALYLVRLDGDPCYSGKDVPLSLLFPGSSAPVRASWYTGELRTAGKPDAVYYVKGGTVTGSSAIARSKK
jgi:hypothetical protein